MQDSLPWLLVLAFGMGQAWMVIAYRLGRQPPGDPKPRRRAARRNTR